MSAAHNLWTDNEIRRCSALGDPEDDFPTKDLMPTEDDDARTSPTISAPPPSEPEPKTATEHDRPIPRDADNPPPPKPESIGELAARELITLYRTAIGMHESLLGASGLLEQSRVRTVEDISIVVDRGFERIWERIEPRLNRQDGKIEAVQSELATLRARVESLETLTKAQGEQLARQETQLAAQAENQAKQEHELVVTKEMIREAEKRLTDARTAQAASAPTPPAEPA